MPKPGARAGRARRSPERVAPAGLTMASQGRRKTATMTTPQQAGQVRARWAARKRARRAAERAARGAEYRARVIAKTRAILIAAAREVGLEQATIEWLINERRNREIGK